MIKINEKSKCCGCGACKNICPKQCIEMQLDEEGFLYPVVDRSQCVVCGLCKEVCHLEKPFTRNDDYQCSFYGAYNNSKKIMRDSSSGGIFWILVKYAIGNNGIVYGVELKDEFYVVHGRAETLNDCVRFRKSKYLQSNTEMIYKQVKADLENSQLVLFSGTPCQIAALYSYLRKDYDNLITCDIVCHGVPSKTVFDKYIAELNAKMQDKAVSICWRDKRNGWSPNRVSVQFESGDEIINTSLENLYQRGFLYNVYLRPSCYECPYARLPRIGDISLGDFLGYEGYLKGNNNNKGLSIVIISSDKGEKVFDEIKDSCVIEKVNESYVKKRSRHAYTHPGYNRNRESFFLNFKKMSFQRLSKKYIYPSAINRAYNTLKNIINYNRFFKEE